MNLWFFLSPVSDYVISPLLALVNSECHFFLWTFCVFIKSYVLLLASIMFTFTSLNFKSPVTFKHTGSLKVHTHLTETLHIGLSFIFVPLVQQFDNLLIFLRFHHRITFQLAQCICILFVGFLHKFYMTLLQFL